MSHDAKRYYAPALDGLRFVAFLFIFLLHYDWPPGVAYTWLAQYFWGGVELFFLLSSFLLTILLCEEGELNGRIDVGAFYRRRILRIAPLYYFYLALIFAIDAPVIANVPQWGERYLSLLGLYDNYSTAVHSYNPIPQTGHLWTIASEMQLYILMPWLYRGLAILSMRWRVLYIASLLIFATAARYGLIMQGHIYPFVWALNVLHPEPILAGMLLAFALHEKTVSDAVMRGLMIVIALCGVAGVAWLGAHGLFNRHTVTGAMGVYPALTALMLPLAYAVIRRGNPLSWALGQKPLAYLGKISYGLYVYHPMCMHYFYPQWTAWGGGWWWTQALPAELVCVIAAASLSYYVIERPMLKLKERYALVASRPV